MGEVAAFAEGSVAGDHGDGLEPWVGDWQQPIAVVAAVRTKVGRLGGQGQDCERSGCSLPGLQED